MEPPHIGDGTPHWIKTLKRFPTIINIFCSLCAYRLPYWCVQRKMWHMMFKDNHVSYREGNRLLLCLRSSVSTLGFKFSAHPWAPTLCLPCMLVS